MRILLIGPLPQPLGCSSIGGASVLFEQLRVEFERKGIDYTVIDTSSNLPRFLLIVHFFWLHTKIALLMMFYDVIGYHASIKSARYYGPIIFLLSKIFRRKMIFRGFGGYYAQWYCETNILMKYVFSKTVLKCDVIFLETLAQVEYLSTVCGKRCEWYSNSRPAWQSNSSPHKKDVNPPIKCVYIGHVMPEKGVNEMVDVIEKLDGNVFVDIYGPLKGGMDENYFSDLRYSKYKGVLSPEKVLETLSEYELLIMPSGIKTEGYPGVIIEAYMAGLAVIASDIGAIPEMVDSTTGLLIRPRSKEDLKAHLSYLIDKPYELNKLQLGAKQKSKEFYSEKWATIYIDKAKTLLK